VTSRDTTQVSLSRRERLEHLKRASQYATGEAGDRFGRVLDVEEGRLLVVGRSFLVEDDQEGPAILFPETVGGRFFSDAQLKRWPELKGKQLFPPERPRAVTTSRLLDDFFSLVEQEDGVARPEVRPSDVQRLARRYGPLEWCMTHQAPFQGFRQALQMTLVGLPERFPPLPEPNEARGECQLSTLDSPCRRWNPEPLTLWVSVGREAVAVRNLAAELRANRRGEPQDWKVLLGEKSESAGAIPDDPHRMLATVMNQRLRLVRIGPAFQWRNGGFQLETFRPRLSPLYAALILQLALMVLKRDGFARCIICGRGFLPTRLGAMYCRSHSIREVNRHKKRRERERKSGV
jgi:hypothetical protein